MGLPPDENLPEVVPDSSPQALTPAQAYGRHAKDEGDAKFTVGYESDATTPKYCYDSNQNQVLAASAPDGTTTSPSPVYASSPPVGYSDPALLGEKDPESGRERRQICGLRRKVFLALLVLVVVVLAAAIGGGVGGAMASKKKQDAAAEAAQAEGTDGSSTGDAPSDGGTSTDPTPVTATVTISADPTSLSADPTGISAPRPTATPAPGSAAPGFDMVAWSEDDFQGKSVELTKVGFIDLPFNSTSYKWHPNGSGCCVTFCLGTDKNVGWRCTDFERKQATSSFNRLFFGCGEDASEENSRCDR